MPKTGDLHPATTKACVAIKRWEKGIKLIRVVNQNLK
jgi:hypothetical protein